MSAAGQCRACRWDASEPANGGSRRMSSASSSTRTLRQNATKCGCRAKMSSCDARGCTPCKAYSNYQADANDLQLGSGSDGQKNLNGAIPREHSMEVKMMQRNLMFVIGFGLAMLGSSFAARAEEGGQGALLKALGDAKLTLQQGIAQVAKGTEVPTEAKYEMDGGKLMLSVYTSAKGFDTASEDNSFIEYKGEGTGASWTPKKEVLADFKH